MTIREALQDLIDGRGELDPAAVLEGYGLDDLSPDALSTALGHFAERSPMDVADALSPIVTRLSDVPFLDSDLPSAGDTDAILADGGGVFELLSQLDGAGEVAESSDPSDFDFGEAAEGLGLDIDGGPGDLVDDSLDALEDTFGTGEYSALSVDGTTDGEPDAGGDDPVEFELALPTEAPSIDDVDGLSDGLLDDLVEQIDDQTDIDPEDLDFDLD